MGREDEIIREWVSGVQWEAIDYIKHGSRRGCKLGKREEMKKEWDKI